MIGAKCWSDHRLVFLHGERQTVHQSETSKKKTHAEVKYVDKLPCHSEKLQGNIRESLQTSNLTEKLVFKEKVHSAASDTFCFRERKYRDWFD